MIGGEMVEGAGAPVIVINPATEEEIATVPSATSSQVDQAVRSSKEAFKPWRKMPAPERGE